MLYYKDLEKGLRFALERNGLGNDPKRVIGRKFRMIVLSPCEERSEYSLIEYGKFRTKILELLENANTDAEETPHELKLCALYGTIRGIYTDDVDAWVLLIDPLETESGRFTSIRLSSAVDGVPTVNPTSIAGVHEGKAGESMRNRSLPCVLTLL
jgi:hypothetical protein